MIYVDSNIFLYPVLYNATSDPYAKAAIQKFGEIAAGRLTASTSWLTWDEVVWIVRRTVGPTEAAQQGRAFLDLPNIQLLDTDREVISKAQDLIDSYEVKPRDAIHAAAAIINGAEEILSEDTDFDAIHELKRVSLLKSR